MSPDAAGYRYSQNDKDIGDAKSFSWEHPIPINDFWNPLDFIVGRNFLQCFSPDEIELLPLDNSESLAKEAKLRLLLKLLQDKLSAGDIAAAPQTLYDVDYGSWDKLVLGIHTMQLCLEQTDAAEESLRELIDRRKDKTNLSYLHSLSVMLEKRGDYVEAEETERKVRLWLDGKVGRDAPQALGSRRIIARAMWKQGPERREEARDLIEEVKVLIEGSGKGRYAVYQQEQREMTEKMVGSLERWEDV